MQTCHWSEPSAWSILASSLANKLFFIRHICRGLSFESWQRKRWPVKAKTWGQIFPKWLTSLSCSVSFNWDPKTCTLLLTWTPNYLSPSVHLLTYFSFPCLLIPTFPFIYSYLLLRPNIWNCSSALRLCSIIVSITIINIVFNAYSVQFSCSVVSKSLWPHEPQHARPPCPSLTPGVHPNPCLLSRWCHPTISSSVIPFSSCPQSFPASGSFQMSQCFASGGHQVVLESQLQHPSFQWTLRTDLL